jgi:hypothetical protein
LVTLIGAVVAVAAGLGLAAGGSAVLIDSSDSDTTPQVATKVHQAFNPLDSPLTIYGSR